MTGEEKNQDAHSTIIENLLYVTVGTSLVTVLSTQLSQVTDLLSIWEAVIAFTGILIPSILFISYIRGNPHRGLWLILDYLEVFFISTHAFLVTQKDLSIYIDVLNYTVSLRAFSLAIMGGYPFLLQTYSMVTKYGRKLTDLYWIFVKKHSHEEDQDISKFFFSIYFITIILGGFEAAIFLGWYLVYFTAMSNKSMYKRKSKRKLIAIIFGLIAPIVIGVFHFFLQNDTPLLLFFVLVFLPYIISWLKIH